MPYDELMNNVKERILDHNDEARSTTNMGIPAELFLERLSFYIKSNFIGLQDNVYVWK